MTNETPFRPPQSGGPPDLLSGATNERQRVDPEHYEQFDSFHSFLKNAAEENEKKVKPLDKENLQTSLDNKNLHKSPDNEYETQRNERQQLEEQSYMEEFEAFHSMYKKEVESRNSANNVWIRIFIITTLLSLACFATWIGLLLSSEIYDSPGNERTHHHSFEMEIPLASNALNNHCNTICKLSKCCQFPNSARRSCLKVRNRCDDLDNECKHLCHGNEEIQENDREIVERITDSCNKDMMKHPRDIMKCSRLCAPRMCCFVSSDDANDSECVYKEQNCSTFSRCTILNMENDINDESFVDVGIVNDSCSMNNIMSNEGYGICQRLCWKRACCFLPESEGGCYSRTGEKWCEEYGACRNLMKVQPRKVVGDNKL